jgi:hypothetical protein
VTALLAPAASVLWGSSDFGGGLISRRLHPSAVVLISQAIALAGLLALAPFVALPSAGTWRPAPWQGSWRRCRWPASAAR